MNKKINFEIKDYGIINEANIELNKINIIGGTNSSGKSTASKVLYSFLRTFSSKKEYIIFEEFVENINLLINMWILKKSDSKIEGPITIENSYEEALFAFKKAERIFKNTNEYNDPYSKMHYDEFFTYVHELIDALEDGKSLFDYKTMSMIVSSEALPPFPNGELSFCGDNFKFTNKLENNSFFHIKFISDVFYIDSISILNLINRATLPEHNEVLLKRLREPNKGYFDNTIDELIFTIKNIINGEYEDHGVDFAFQDNGEFTSFSGNTASGIKQIGIVQILLNNKLLKNNCYLIIDEPEVNLHPEWQFKFAEILVLLSKDLNITLYLNSHSPMFIEAINTFCEFYDMEDDVNYYLTEKSENKGKYNFTKIKRNELYRLYENLGNPYKLINKLKIKKHLRNR